MDKLYFGLVAALLLTPAPALTFAGQQAERIAPKQKSWLPANFRTGLSRCAVHSTRDGTALSGAGMATFEGPDGDGLAFAIAGGGTIAPSVTALAIKTKGTSAHRGDASETACAAGASDAAAGGAPRCSVSGDPDAPTVRFTVPLSALGDAGQSAYVGTVTIVKRAAGSPLIASFLSKKGYDYYAAQNGRAVHAGTADTMMMTVVAACDTSALKAKTGAGIATYDLAVGKKV